MNSTVDRFSLVSLLSTEEKEMHPELRKGEGKGLCIIRKFKIMPYRLCFLNMTINFSTNNKILEGKIILYLESVFPKAPLNNSWAEEETTKELTKYLEQDGNKNTTYRSVWDAVKVALTHRCRAADVSVKEKKGQTSKRAG